MCCTPRRVFVDRVAARQPIITSDELALTVFHVDDREIERGKCGPGWKGGNSRLFTGPHFTTAHCRGSFAWPGISILSAIGALTFGAAFSYCFLRFAFLRPRA